jgi:hypothetical protein
MHMSMNSRDVDRVLSPRNTAERTRASDLPEALTLHVPTSPLLATAKRPATREERDAAFVRLSEAHKACLAVRVEIRSAHYSVREATRKHTQLFNEYIAAFDAWESLIVDQCVKPSDFQVKERSK